MDTIILKITPELKILVKAVVLAKAWVEIVHPIVTGYQRTILRELGDTDSDTGEAITDPKNTYRMHDDKFARYLKRCDEEAAKNNLRHKPDCCPLLEAESMERSYTPAMSGRPAVAARLRKRMLY